MGEVSCKNCGHKFEGDFCPFCGQKAATSEINFKYFTSELPYGLFQVNKGLLFTIKEFTIRPGEAALDYIAGKRIKYFLPFSYILLMASFFLLSRNGVKQVHPEIYENIKDVSDPTPFLGFIFAGLSPFLGLAYFWLFRKLSGINFWQYTITAVYYLGHLLFIMVLYRLLYFPFPWIKEYRVVILVALIIYMIFSCYSFHRRFQKSTILLLIKSMLSIAIFASVLFFTAFIIGLALSLFGFLTVE